MFLLFEVRPECFYVLPNLAVEILISPNSPGVFYRLPFTIRHKRVSDMLEDDLCLHLTKLEVLSQKQLTVF